MRTTAYIITCPKLAPIRLPSLLDKVVRLKDAGAISDIKIIDQDDYVYNSYSSKNYSPKLWGEHLAIGAPYFSYNIVSACQHAHNFPVIYGDAIDSLASILPVRELTAIEHSIANRHHFALKQIGESDGIGIVFEDDVILNDEPLESKKLLSAIYNISKPYFFDLCDMTVALPQLGNRIVVGEHICRKLKHAFVRTLQTYAINQATAKILLDYNMQYSLPADMHLQIVLDRLAIPGLSFYHSGFLHGSKIGVFNSTTGRS